MLARILVRALFKDIWSLKERCMHATGASARCLRFMYHYYQYEHGSAIAYASQFKTAPSFPRGMKQVVISEDAVIGASCTIFHQVTIDNDSRPESPTFGSPVIGDACYLYPGVKIIGNVTIGDNVVIKANVAIEADVPSNTVVCSTSKQSPLEKH